MQESMLLYLLFNLLKSNESNKSYDCLMNQYQNTFKNI